MLCGVKDFMWSPSWLWTDPMLGLVKESELCTKFVTPCAHMALIGYPKRLIKFLITKMGEFWQLSFGLYLNLVVMKFMYTAWQPNPTQNWVRSSSRGGHSQNKWLSWVGHLFWECPPPKAQLPNILNLKASSSKSGGT